LVNSILILVTGNIYAKLDLPLENDCVSVHKIRFNQKVGFYIYFLTQLNPYMFIIRQIWYIFLLNKSKCYDSVYVFIFNDAVNKNNVFEILSSDNKFLRKKKDLDFTSDNVLSLNDVNTIRIFISFI